MTALSEIENQAGIARITCGWKKSHLSLEVVRRYWRDVHSPAISRRAGLYEYRHSQYDAVRPDLAVIHGIESGCAADSQLMWLSDVRYRDQAGLDAFSSSPESADVKALLLTDIDLIVERSTTYKAVGDSARTVLDLSPDATPQGAPKTPSFGVFFRRGGDPADFMSRLKQIAQAWGAMSGVLRLRVNLLEAPDMEAEKKAGYPIKTHPPEQQYQAWFELVVENENVFDAMWRAAVTLNIAAAVATIHVYPVAALYCFVYRGRPTLPGLRGYCAYQAITEIGAVNQQDPRLLTWMFGEIAAPASSERSSA